MMNLEVVSKPHLRLPPAAGLRYRPPANVLAHPAVGGTALSRLVPP
jgi:hypothetical protein